LWNAQRAADPSLANASVLELLNQLANQKPAPGFEPVPNFRELQNGPLGERRKGVVPALGFAFGLVALLHRGSRIEKLKGGRVGDVVARPLVPPPP
jgi:hypothetical protein